MSHDYDQPEKVTTATRPGRLGRVSFVWGNASDFRIGKAQTDQGAAVDAVVLAFASMRREVRPHDGPCGRLARESPLQCRTASGIANPGPGKLLGRRCDAGGWPDFSTTGSSIGCPESCTSLALLCSLAGSQPVSSRKTTCGTTCHPDGMFSSHGSFHWSPFVDSASL